MWENLDGIAWHELEDACGKAHSVPENLRLLTSQQQSDRWLAIEQLYMGICDEQCTVNSATPFAVPFLIDLAAEPSTYRRQDILRLLGDIVRATSYHLAHQSMLDASEIQAPEFHQNLETERRVVAACRSAVWQGVEVYLQLLNEPQTEISYHAARVLGKLARYANEQASGAQTVQRIGAALREHFQQCDEPSLRCALLKRVDDTAAHVPENAILIREWAAIQGKSVPDLALRLRAIACLSQDPNATLPPIALQWLSDLWDDPEPGLAAFALYDKNIFGELEDENFEDEAENEASEIQSGETDDNSSDDVSDLETFPDSIDGVSVIKIAPPSVEENDSEVGADEDYPFEDDLWDDSDPFADDESDFDQVLAEDSQLEESQAPASLPEALFKPNISQWRLRGEVLRILREVGDRHPETFVPILQDILEVRLCQKLGIERRVLTADDWAQVKTFNDGAQVKTFDLSEDLQCDQLLPLLAPAINLEKLWLTSSERITDAGLEAMPFFPRLRDLNLAGNPITDVGIAQLQRFPQLEELSLVHMKVTVAALETVAQLKQLRNLMAGDVRLDDAGAVQLAQLRHLERLWAYNAQLSDAGVQSLAQIRSLTELDLPSVKVSAIGAAALAALPYLKSLRIIADDSTLRALAVCQKMQRLDGNGDATIDDGVAALRPMPALQELNLVGTSITDASIPYLQAISGLKYLRVYRTQMKPRTREQWQMLFPYCEIRADFTQDQSSDEIDDFDDSDPFADD